MSAIASVRPRRIAGVASFVAIASLAATPASAALLQGTMTWQSVSGTYNGVAFTNQQMSITFVYDTAAVFLQSGEYRTYFANGQGAAGEAIRVTIGGGVLSSAALDNLSGNTTALGAGADYMLFGAASSPSTYLGDLSVLYNMPTTPVAADKLTTIWSGTTPNGAFVGAGRWSSNPLTIGGFTLQLTAVGSSSVGGWSSTTFTPTVVPGAGLAGVMTLGVAGFARRRRGC